MHTESQNINGISLFLAFTFCGPKFKKNKKIKINYQYYHFFSQLKRKVHLFFIIAHTPPLTTPFSQSLPGLSPQFQRKEMCRGRSPPSFTSGLWNSRPAREWIAAQQYSQ